jgi:hypothetical protein
MKLVSLIFLGLFAMLFGGCQKDDARLTVSEMLVNKRWYLEKRVIQADNNTTTYNYLGLPSYYFFLQDKFSDSDGYSGTYLIEELSNETFLQLQPEQRTAERYRILHVGVNYLVVDFAINSATNTLYFSTRL